MRRLRQKGGEQEPDPYEPQLTYCISPPHRRGNLKRQHRKNWSFIVKINPLAARGFRIASSGSISCRKIKNPRHQFVEILFE